jgi:hypothetical protein
VLAMKHSEILRGPDGVPTAHINSIVHTIIKYKEASIDQYWVIDYDEVVQKTDFHNFLKSVEVKSRTLQKKKAAEKVKALKSELKKMTEEEYLFGADDEKVDNGPLRKELMQQIESNIKRSFRFERFYVEDLIFILDMLDIPWCMAPRGYDAEHICAAATYDENIMGIKMDCVLSPDTDTIVFGATNVLKRDTRKKKFYLYNAETIEHELGIDRTDLAKIAVILGCDYTKYEENGKIVTGKTKGVGALTVLKKFRDIKLTPIQQAAVDRFLHTFTQEEIDSIDVHNADNAPFTNVDKYNKLLDWLEFVKGFNRPRITKAFAKAQLFV